MKPSWRKPAAALAILGLIALWSAAVVALSPWIGRLPGLAQAPVYVVLGFAWIWLLPLKSLLLWSETGRWHG